MAEVKKRWVEAPSISGRWNPQAPRDVGDKLHGVYLKKEPAPYMGRDNLKYFIQTDHPCATDDGIAIVYGTNILNDRMKDIQPGKGYEIEIEFKGEHKTGDRTKKPLKLFVVRALITKDDPLYKKWYPEESEDGEAAPAAEMNLKDDAEAKQLIENYTEIHKADHHDQDPTAEELIKLSETDPDIDDTMKSRVKAEVAAQVKSGKIKTRGGD